jgi:hypothetical protein
MGIARAKGRDLLGRDGFRSTDTSGQQIGGDGFPQRISRGCVPASVVTGFALGIVVPGAANG